MSKDFSDLLKIFSLILLILFLSSSSKAQYADDIEKEHNILTYQWLFVSEGTKSYEGIAEYCLKPEYKAYTIEVLENLHHYESIVLDMIKYPRPEISLSKKSRQKVVDDITAFKAEYDVESVVSFLDETCELRYQLESNKKAKRSKFGGNSYKGKSYMIETGLRRYLKNIDKRIMAIDNHVLLIDPQRIMLHDILAENVD
ncbi:MAG: hypothetical protein RJQ09_10505 [Cyclobacteriaceae bacterium]